MRIEKRSVEGGEELKNLAVEALTGVIGDFVLIEDLPAQGKGNEVGFLAGDSTGRVLIVVASDGNGDGLIPLYGKHLEWVKRTLSTLVQRHSKFDWSVEPGVIMIAEAFSDHTLLLAAMLSVRPMKSYSMKCLGIGAEKGLYIEKIELPEVRVGVEREERVEHDLNLLSKTVDRILEAADRLSVSASFGYLSKSLDWVPVANLRSNRGRIWVESGPGTWSAKRVEDDESLERVIDRIGKSYAEIVKAKGEARDSDGVDLSEAERESLSMD